MTEFAVDVRADFRHPDLVPDTFKTSECLTFTAATLVSNHVTPVTTRWPSLKLLARQRITRTSCRWKDVGNANFRVAKWV